MTMILILLHFLTGDDIKQVKEKFGFSPEESYVVPKEVSTQEEGKEFGIRN
jgi:hypothetical protein